MRNELSVKQSHLDRRPLSIPHSQVSEQNLQQDRNLGARRSRSPWVSTRFRPCRGVWVTSSTDWVHCDG